MNKKYLISTVLAICSSAALAQTASSELNSSSKFDVVDTNKDGVLMQQELNAGGQVTLPDADVDGNGSVSRSEFDAAVNVKQKQNRQNLDTEIRSGTTINQPNLDTNIQGGVRINP